MISNPLQTLPITLHILDCGLGLGFLLETSRGLFLIDCGSPGQELKVLEKMKELGRTDLKLIWITHAHYDHYGSAAALRKLTGARIGAHSADAESLTCGRSPLGTPRQYGFIYFIAQPLVSLALPLHPTPPDFTLEDGDSLESYGLEAVAVHTPGHTPGHSSLLLKNGTAFAGDLIGGSAHPHVQSLLATDWSQLSGSLDHLQAAQPDWVYSGHSHHPVPGSLFQQIKSEPSLRAK